MTCGKKILDVTHAGNVVSDCLVVTARCEASNANAADVQDFCVDAFHGFLASGKIVRLPPPPPSPFNKLQMVKYE